MTFANLTISPCALTNSCVLSVGLLPILCLLCSLKISFATCIIPFANTLHIFLFMFPTYTSTKAPVSHRKIQVIFPLSSVLSFVREVSVQLHQFSLSLPHFRYTLCRKFSLV